MELAQSIGPGLAKNTVAGRINDRLVDACDLITEDATVQIITPTHTRKLPARHVEQRRVGKHAVKESGRQFEPKEVLMPDFTLTVGTRHMREAFGTVKANRPMAEIPEDPEVPSRAAAEIEYRKWRLARDMAQ